MLSDLLLNVSPSFSRYIKVFCPLSCLFCPRGRIEFCRGAKLKSAEGAELISAGGAEKKTEGRKKIAPFGRDSAPPSFFYAPPKFIFCPCYCFQKLLLNFLYMS